MNPCLLSCYNEEKHEFYLDKKIPNGERCNDGEHNNICVYGKCQVWFQTFSQLTLRSSRLEVFSEKDIPKNFAIITIKHFCWSLTKKRLQHRCSPVNIAKFLKAPILKNLISTILGNDSSIGNILSKMCTYTFLKLIVNIPEQFHALIHSLFEWLWKHSCLCENRVWAYF